MSCTLIDVRAFLVIILKFEHTLFLKSRKILLAFYKKTLDQTTCFVAKSRGLSVLYIFRKLQNRLLRSLRKFERILNFEIRPFAIEIERILFS